MGCGLSKLEVEERGPNPEVRFVYPKNEAPIVNDKDVRDELSLAETEQSCNNNGRKSLSVERGFLKKVLKGNSSEKGGEKDADGDQGGRKSISCNSNSPLIMENGLFEKESGSNGKYREFFQDGNVKRVNSQGKDNRFSVEMAREEARRISIEVAVKEAQSINVEVEKEEKKMNYYANSTMEDAKLPCRRTMGKEEQKMPRNTDQAGKGHKYVNEEKAGNGEEYLRENSLLFPPGSPSFRIYCLLDKDGTCDNADDGDQETPGSKLPPTGREKSTKRGKRSSLLRTVLNRGGSATGVKKNFLHVKNSVPTQSSSSSKVVEKSA